MYIGGIKEVNIIMILDIQSGVQNVLNWDYKEYHLKLCFH